MGVKEKESSPETCGLVAIDGNQGIMVVSSLDGRIGHSNNANEEDEAIGRVNTKVELGLCKGSSSLVAT